MTDPPPRGRPTIKPPVQALPVLRDNWTTPSAGATARGVEAAQSMCSDLKGLARQMCYATNYGVSV